MNEISFEINPNFKSKNCEMFVKTEMKVQANWPTIAEQQVVQWKKNGVDQEKMNKSSPWQRPHQCRRNELQSNGPDFLINF